MGGLPCAKEVIDGGRAARVAVAKVQAALDKALGCMDNSILLYAATNQPTYAQRDELLKRCEMRAHLAPRPSPEYAAEIEAYVSAGQPQGLAEPYDEPGPAKDYPEGPEAGT